MVFIQLLMCPKNLAMLFGNNLLEFEANRDDYVELTIEVIHGTELQCCVIIMNCYIILFIKSTYCVFYKYKTLITATIDYIATPAKPL